MKLSKEELLNKVNSSTLSDDEKISFMEDISDSIVEQPETTEDVEEIKGELNEVRKKLEDLTIRYKERFLSSDNKDDKSEDDDTIIEDEVIDVKEI